MWVEMILASAATFIWWWTGPGLLNGLCLDLMFVCSVSTVLFNGNPLLRYDGYYILSDLVEVPNLQEQSSRVVRRWLARWLLDVELPLDRLAPITGRAGWRFMRSPRRRIGWSSSWRSCGFSSECSNRMDWT